LHEIIILAQTLLGCGIDTRMIDIHHVRQARMHSTCQESRTPSSHQYIYVQHHFIREKLENQEICLKYCPRENMVVLTKPLAKDWHQTLTRAMGLKAFDYSQNGSVENRALDCL